MTEKELELMLVKEVKRRGGRAYKFISPGINGVLTTGWCFCLMVGLGL
ncbi:MAG: hypothetical protein RQM92_14285 [Candidatus Syntrophopropionicum ammoniitolerans]